jgi:hypothetical protein
MIKRIAFIFIFFVSFLNTGIAQENNAGSYLKQSIDGYIHLYFDEQYFLVDEKCSFKTYTRVIKYNKEQGGFNSFFIDYHNNNTQALTGKYVNGKKEGVFKQFYPNGKPKSLSYFNNNLPVGDWQYFYPSGNIWMSVKYENLIPYIMEYWNEKGIQKVKSGKGKYEFTQQTFDFNEYGYTGTIAKGRLKAGRPIGVWTNYLEYSKAENELIGNEYFSKKGFEKSYYIFPKNISDKTSLIQILPTLAFNNTATLKYKNCTIDDQKQFNSYLQNHLNASLSLIWKLDSIPIANSFVAIVDVNKDGKSTMVQISKEVPQKFSEALIFILKSVNYWIPSFSEGKTIDDTLEITFFKDLDENGEAIFAYPIIKRQKES